MRDSIEPLPLTDVLKWNSDGLIPAVVQDVETGDVLMLAWMDEPALRATIATGQTHFYSRSRRSHWHKGGTSGHVQHVESIWVDCDGDVILIKARQVGGACHEGYRSCFFRRLGGEGWEVAARPVFDAAAVYGLAEGAGTEAVETNSHGASVFDLSPSEKLQLAEDLRDDLAAGAEPVLVHDWQKEELARRKTNLLNNPASGLTWEEVRRRVTTPSVQVGPGPEPAEG